MLNITNPYSQFHIAYTSFPQHETRNVFNEKWLIFVINFTWEMNTIDLILKLPPTHFPAAG